MSSTRIDQQDRNAGFFQIRRIFTVVLALGLFGLAGCGWLFGKQGKPMTIIVEFTAADSLNFDGETAQAVQVKAYVLKNTARFMAGDVRAFFDPTFDPGFIGDLQKNDTLKTSSVILAPGETKSIEMVVPFYKARDMKPALGIIADFYRPPTEKTERLSFEMKKKTKQTIRISVGRNWVAKKGK